VYTRTSRLQAGKPTADLRESGGNRCEAQAVAVPEQRRQLNACPFLVVAIALTVKTREDREQ